MGQLGRMCHAYQAHLGPINSVRLDLGMYLFQSCSFFNIVQNAPPPLPFKLMVDIFSMDCEALCTDLRIDNIRHRSEETM